MLNLAGKMICKQILWSASCRTLSVVVRALNNINIRQSIWNRKEMSTQKTISNFFKPVNKRTTSQDTQDGASPKKSKVSGGKENINDNRAQKMESSLNSSENCLSPDQKQRMSENKLKAEIKLQCRRTPGLHENFGVSWYTALQKEFSKPYFEELSKFVVSKRNQTTVYPPAEQVFSWTHHCDLKDIKVVVLGQDPYHGPGQAHGLCFSVQKGIQPPPSLVNMYKELESDILGFTRPSHGHLIGWAKQGKLI
ncbi:hypothetical protein SK128_017590 [Halocaridina rubra]|uniref:Uracil-DNA glycosylase n=1 Tax=Halocaridina rubra TaxID=373956 RepID=A0AAN8XEK8_HALRR